MNTKHTPLDTRGECAILRPCNTTAKHVDGAGKSRLDHVALPATPSAQKNGEPKTLKCESSKSDDGNCVEFSGNQITEQCGPELSGATIQNQTASNTSSAKIGLQPEPQPEPICGQSSNVTEDCAPIVNNQSQNHGLIQKTREDSTILFRGLKVENMKQSTSLLVAKTATQSKATWTPGPWHVGESHTDEPAIRNTDNDCVAVACELLEGEADANARLIASAPELLAALEAVAGSLDSCLRSKTSEKMWREVAFLNREFARAAITQAKGTK